MHFSMKKGLAWTLALLLPYMAAAEPADAPAQVIVYFQDGARVLLPAEIANDPQQLAAYCDMYFPGRAYTVDPNAKLTYDAVLSAEGASALFGEGSFAVGAGMVTLGLNTSVVTIDGVNHAVPTSALTFDPSVDARHRIAVVYAPRSGEASLRETASGSAEKIETCKTGRIVAVLEYEGGTYTRIRYDGTEGYIRTDCLLFHDGAEAVMGTGTLHIKGATDGKGNVTAYAEGSSSRAKVAAWPSGTAVQVFDLEDGWYCVENDGWVGYVPATSLELDGQ